MKDIYIVILERESYYSAIFFIIISGDDVHLYLIAHDVVFRLYVQMVRWEETKL